jgi:hypothetical protein
MVPEHHKRHKGRWRITINRVGWLFDDPHGGGQNQDVSYPSRGRVTIRSSIEEPILGQYNRGGAFCGIEPDPPVTYSYAVSKHHRRLATPGDRRRTQRLPHGPPPRRLDTRTH